LKIIAPQNRAKVIFKVNSSKIIESAKKEETTARRAVNTIVIPILAYFVTSKRGQLSKISRLAPEHRIRNLFIKLILLRESITYSSILSKNI
tara:strand:+ start:119 stop:394 length:276 start_codon:yes stop_codon:yes gene_type:complete